MNSHELVEALSHMPPLRHSIPGQEFDYRKSEVLKWVMNVPGIEDWLWRRISEFNRRVPVLKYDKETGLWRGNPEGVPEKWKNQLCGRPRKFRPPEYGPVMHPTIDVE